MGVGGDDWGAGCMCTMPIAPSSTYSPIIAPLPSLPLPRRTFSVQALPSQLRRQRSTRGAGGVSGTSTVPGSSFETAGQGQRGVRGASPPPPLVRGAGVGERARGAGMGGAGVGGGGEEGHRARMVSAMAAGGWDWERSALR